MLGTFIQTVGVISIVLRIKEMFNKNVLRNVIFLFEARIPLAYALHM